MVIQHNMSAMNANRQLGINTDNKEKISEKLNTGYRINRAADDAAGLTISETMRWQIRGLNKASSNAQDGINFIQTAEGALNEVHSMLDRCKELSVQAANDTNTAEDRQAIQAELDQLGREIDRIASTTEYNTMHVFSGYDDLTNDSVRAGETSYEIIWSFVDNDGNRVPAVDQSQAVGSATNYPANGLAEFVQHAAASAVSNLRSLYPDLFANAGSDQIQIGLNLNGIDGPGGTLASAQLGLSASSSYTVMNYTLNVDTSDYGIAEFNSMTDAQKADLAATIAHEMTHLVMYDTLTDGMLSNRQTSFPQWFVEGMAQTSSGDGNWIEIDGTASDDEIRNYMQELSTNPYGSGYLAAMCLGQMASGASTVSSASIRSGLNALLGDLAQGMSLDEAIAANTSYTSLRDFEHKFQQGRSTELQVVRDLLTATGSGAGSLMGNLSDTQEQVFAPARVGGAPLSPDYAVNTDNTRYANEFGSGYDFPPPASTADMQHDSGLHLQVGALENQAIMMYRYDVSCTSLLPNGLDVSDFEHAGETIEAVEIAIEKVSSVRSYYGGLQNRLEHTIANVDNIAENTQAAESLIRDTDMAKCMVMFSSYNILQQAGQSMLAQANKMTEGVLSLLQ